MPAGLGRWPKGPNGPGERFAATKRQTRIRVCGERHADGSGTSQNRCRPGRENDYFFPFLPFLFFFLLFLPFLATPITPLPDWKVNEVLTKMRQRIIDRYRVSNTL